MEYHELKSILDDYNYINKGMFLLGVFSVPRNLSEVTKIRTQRIRREFLKEKLREIIMDACSDGQRYGLPVNKGDIISQEDYESIVKNYLKYNKVSGNSRVSKFMFMGFYIEAGKLCLLRNSFDNVIDLIVVDSFDNDSFELFDFEEQCTAILLENLLKD